MTDPLHQTTLTGCNYCGHEWAEPDASRCLKCGHSDLRTVPQTTEAPNLSSGGMEPRSGGSQTTPTHSHGRGVNDNRHPPIPVPRGGFRTNEDEARWLAQTIEMRMAETLAAAGIPARIAPNGLYDLFLLSLNAASRRSANAR